MAITALPTAPQRLSAPETFNTAMDAFLAALPTMVTQINAALSSFGPGVPYCTVSGTNTKTVTSGLSLSSLVTGQRIVFKDAAANAGSTTINLDGTGAKTCKTPTGANLPSGYIRTDVLTEAWYDGTNWIVDRKIETGSNDNGRYVRFADGTQICTWSSGSVGPIDTASGNVFRSGEITWPAYPAAFAAVTPKVIWTVDHPAGQGGIWLARETTQATTSTPGGTYMMRSVSSSVTTAIVGATAIGRWF